MEDRAPIRFGNAGHPGGRVFCGQVALHGRRARCGWCWRRRRWRGRARPRWRTRTWIGRQRRVGPGRSIRPWRIGRRGGYAGRSRGDRWPVRDGRDDRIGRRGGHDGRPGGKRRQHLLDGRHDRIGRCGGHDGRPGRHRRYVRWRVGHDGSRGNQRHDWPRRPSGSGGTGGQRRHRRRACLTCRATILPIRAARHRLQRRAKRALRQRRRRRRRVPEHDRGRRPVDVVGASRPSRSVRIRVRSRFRTTARRCGSASTAPTPSAR